MTAGSAVEIDGLHQGVFQPHLLVRGLSRNPDRPLLRFGESETLTVGQFRDLVSQYCQALASFGLEKGARVGILSANRPEVLILTAACLIGQYVLVPLHSLGSLDDHSYIVEDSGIEAFVFDAAAFADRAAEILARTSVRVPLAFGPTKVGTDLCAAAATKAPAPLIAPFLTGDETYRLSYSGGTTGKPKAVIGTHRLGLAVLTIQLAEWEWPEKVCQLVCAPLSHAGAAMFLPTLLRGGSLVILPGFEPVKAMAAIQKHRITCVLLVPTMIYALLDHPRFPEFDLSSLEIIFYGASAISAARLREGITKLGPVFFQFYGQVEAPMTITILRRNEHDVDNPARLASCGRPVPWLHVALLDDQFREVPQGEPGEICVRGPLVMAGYLGLPQQTAEAFAGGWLHTGDVAVCDSEGYLRIVDRKKDMIITGGFNVYPREIEDVLGNHKSVSACAVIGVPDQRWGEAVIAVVVLRAGALPCAEELRDLVREKKGAVQAPKAVEFIDAIPLTSLGKPDKKKLREQFSAVWKGKPHDT